MNPRDQAHWRSELAIVRMGSDLINQTPPRNKGGRPSKFDQDEVMRVIWQIGELGQSFKETFAPFSRWSLWRWAKKRGLCHLLHAARARRRILWKVGAVEHGYCTRKNRAERVTRTLKKWRVEFADQVGSTVRETARLLHVSPNTVMTWQRKYPEFRLAQVRAHIVAEMPRLKRQVDDLQRRVEAAKRR